MSYADKPWTPQERIMCHNGYVYLKDAKQTRDNMRATCRNLDQYERKELIFDYSAWYAQENAQ
jgi:hypothetical protein